MLPGCLTATDANLLDCSCLSLPDWYAVCNQGGTNFEPAQLLYSWRWQMLPCSCIIHQSVDGLGCSVKNCYQPGRYSCHVLSKIYCTRLSVMHGQLPASWPLRGATSHTKSKHPSQAGLQSSQVQSACLTSPHVKLIAALTGT